VQANAKPLADREPAEGVRLVALDLLRDAESAAAQLADPRDAEALHDFRVAARRLRSWLRSFAPQVEDTLGRKRGKRLKAIASATGAARDAEVLLALLTGQRDALAPSHRGALDALSARLAERAAAAGADPKAEAAARFAKLAPKLASELSRYERKVGAPERRFGEVAAAALRSQSARLLDALGAIAGPDDVERAHETRIEGKRLRYLLEPLRALTPAAADAVKHMKGLQELLGELHDVHVLAGEIATALAELGADGSRGVHREGGRGAARKGPRAGLLALAQLVRARRDALFAELEERWLGGAGEALLADVEAAAAALEGPPARRPPSAPPSAARG
jgi:CHAD domain-containing protein